MNKMLWTLGLPCLISMMACHQPAPTLDLEQGQLRLALTDPDLAGAIITYVAAIYLVTDDTECVDLLEMTPDELELQRQRQPTSSAAAAFSLDDKSAFDFGRVEPSGERALVMLGSKYELVQQGTPETSLDPSRQILPQLTGSVIAIGCRQLLVEPDQRFSADVVLFPAGLR